MGVAEGEQEIQRDLLHSAPPHGIDYIKRRGALAQPDNRAGDRLIEMLVESGLLVIATTPLENELSESRRRIAFVLTICPMN